MARAARFDSLLPLEGSVLGVVSTRTRAAAGYTVMYLG